MQNSPIGEYFLTLENDDFYSPRRRGWQKCGTPSTENMCRKNMRCLHHHSGEIAFACYSDDPTVGPSAWAAFTHRERRNKRSYSEWYKRLRTQRHRIMPCFARYRRRGAVEPGLRKLGRNLPNATAAQVVLSSCGE